METETQPPLRRSARYANRGYHTYKEPDLRRGGRGEEERPARPAAQDGYKKRKKAASDVGQSAEDEAVAPPLEEGGDKKSKKAATDVGPPSKGEAVARHAAEGEAAPPPVDGAVDGTKSWKMRVKETLRAFNSHYLHFIQEKQRSKEAAKQKAETARNLKLQKSGEEGKTKSPPKKGVSKGHKQKKVNNQDKDRQKEKRPRPDLQAITKMQETNAVLYRQKRIGHLPGIDVGDQFYSRAEMVALGFHSHWLNGIDYMGQKYQGKKGYENLTFPLATCIVMSGIYEDDLDKADEIIYTGQGGNDLLGSHRQKGQQLLRLGNLALKNSKDNGNPIRVVRGHIAKSSYSGKVYTYDGLYKVVDYWAQKGVQGHLVFKYKLMRLEGQPLLTTSQVQFTRGEALPSISGLSGLVCEDISGGQENFPIPATNLVDDPPVPPSGFMYSNSLQIPENFNIPADSIGCSCEGDCSSSKHCSCAQRNGSDLPYVSCNKVGRLVEPKAVVFECGANCRCHCDCVNRTSQQGLKYHLEVFKTASKGWGVRTWDIILPGAPICEYTGLLRKAADIDGLMEDNYIFDIDCLQTMKGLDGREQRPGSELHIPSFHAENDLEAPPAPEYCIDAGSVGNIARFINHSCQPNLFVQCILSSHSDVKLAKVMLFSADTILPLQELTYDYGYRLDSVIGPDGNVVKLACHCGASDCRKRLY